MAIMLSSIVDDSSLFANPHLHLRELREEFPVVWDERLRSWVVTNYRQAVQVLSSSKVAARRIVRAEMTGLEVEHSIERLVDCWAAFSNPPQHARLRSLGIYYISRLAERVSQEDLQKMAEQVLSNLGIEFDFVESFARPYSEEVIGRVLRIPEEDRVLVRQFFDKINNAFGSLLPDDAALRSACEGLRSLRSYFSGHLRGFGVSTEELAGIGSMLAFGGYGTVYEALSLSGLGFCGQPNIFAELKQKGLNNTAFCESAVEEMLRWDGPTFVITRFAMELLRVGRAEIEPGQRILVVAAAANRDPRIFAGPDNIRFRRINSRRHLTFGFGVHRCLAEQLARRQIGAAFHALVRRFSRLELSGPAEWNHSVINRGLRKLVVKGCR